MAGGRDVARPAARDGCLKWVFYNKPGEFHHSPRAMSFFLKKKLPFSDVVRLL